MNSHRRLPSTAVLSSSQILSPFLALSFSKKCNIAKGKRITKIEMKQ